MVRGYDTSQLFREDALRRIRGLEREANDCARQMNEIIRENNLPEEPVELPFPETDEDDNPDCD